MLRHLAGSKVATIRFRPHHFLCAYCFEGKGYSSAFIDHFQQLVDTLQAPDGEAVSIEIVNTTDTICGPCPHRSGTQCLTEDKIARLDQAHATTLGFHPPQHITWGQAKQQLAERLTLAAFHHICQGCEWKASGICEHTIKTKLLKSDRLLASKTTHKEPDHVKADDST